MGGEVEEEELSADRYLIDIHSHLLPGFDDGAADWDESLQMLRQGVEDGIREVILTPHILSQMDLEREDEIVALFEDFKKRAAAEGIAIKFHLACELFLQPDMNLTRRIATLDETGRYFLVEFPMSVVPDFVTKRFFEMVIEDKIPIVAHPERNVTIIRNPDKAVDLVERGALLQINAGSLLGVFGRTIKDIATKLMEADLVHFVATDCHDPRSRTLQLSPAYDLVTETWGEEHAELLFCVNPKKVLDGEIINSPEPKPEQLRPKKRRFNLFRRKSVG